MKVIICRKCGQLSWDFLNENRELCLACANK